MGNCFDGAAKQTQHATPKGQILKRPPPGNFKVCIVGGAGGIGQPLSLLMAMDPNVKELCVYDLDISLTPVDGVARDLSHVGRANITSWTARRGDTAIESAESVFRGCHLVLVSTSVARKPGQDRKEHLNTNAGIAKNIVEACAKYCPQALIGLIMIPVNSVVPAMCELWKKQGLNPKNIIGVSTLDVVRANCFVHEATGTPVEDLDVPVVGGNSEATILPLFSQDKAAKTLSDQKVAELNKKVQMAGNDVTQAKKGKGSATLSLAYAGARLARGVLAGLAGQEGVTECAYVESTACPGVPFFSSRLTFGKNGVSSVQPLPPLGQLSAYERKRLEELKPILLEEIQEGLEYAEKNAFAQ